MAPSQPTPAASEAGLTTRQVFEQHGPYAYRALRYFGVPESDLPDVCQEVFLIVHRKLADFQGRSSVRTWLYRICQRAASDFRKRAYVRREVLAEAPQDLGEPTPGASAGGQLEARAVLMAALDRLDDDKRAVFVLFEIEGMTMREVAEVLQCPLQTAYSRLHAARHVVEQFAKTQTRGAA